MTSNEVLAYLLAKHEWEKRFGTDDGFVLDWMERDTEDK